MTSRPTVTIYATTLILSAFLLFSVQVLFSKMLLPLLGGSPSVWNTAMVFFQALLLAGYGYAHITSQRLTIRTQAVLHIILLALAGLVLPLAIPAGAGLPADENPALWQLGIMAMTVGAPFFVMSASAPMIQRWFAGTDHPDAANPYFLYAASNIGSMAALLLYPVTIEPLMTLHLQNAGWAFGYAALVFMTILCAFLVWGVAARTPMPYSHNVTSVAPPPSARLRMTWVALAFIPSSLMLGLTTYVTTDIASAPMLWIIPLALYLLTFIIVFARNSRVTIGGIIIAFNATLAILLFLVSSGLANVHQVFFLVHPLLFFIACLLCHKQLANLRPPAGHLTSFYVYMSLGGVLGGLFNAFIAPALFVVPVEYTLALCAVVLVRCMVMADGAPLASWPRIRVELRPRVVIMLIISLAMVYASMNAKSPALNLMTGVMVTVTIASLRLKPFTYAVFATIVLLVHSPIRMVLNPNLVHIERNYFGVLRITEGADTRNFLHGTTLHGAQPRNPANKLNPITYYSPIGGYGDAFSALPGKEQDIAVIGLGVGSLACFTQPGRSFDFYEIDPDVVKIAEDRNFFTFLSDCGSPYNIIVGDGRMKIAESGKKYTMIVADAFSSDNIPVHVMTYEALKIYESRLADGGIILFHISNRYLHLEPVIKAIGDMAGMHTMVKITPKMQTLFDPDISYSPSTLTALTHDADRAELLRKMGWRDANAPAGYRAWTDDYANVIAALNVLRPGKSRKPVVIDVADEE